MKNLMLTTVFFMVIACAFVQTSADTIEMKKQLGTVFRLHGKNLTPRELLSVFAPNAEAYAEMKLAKKNNDVGSVFAGAGGFLIGWPVGTAIGGGEPEWVLAGIGAGLVAISIPFAVAYIKHAKKATRIYNDALSKPSTPDVGFTFGITRDGMGVTISF